MKTYSKKKLHLNPQNPCPDSYYFFQKYQLIFVQPINNKMPQQQQAGQMKTQFNKCNMLVLLTNFPKPLALLMPKSCIWPIPSNHKSPLFNNNTPTQTLTMRLVSGAREHWLSNWHRGINQSAWGFEPNINHGHDFRGKSAQVLVNNLAKMLQRNYSGKRGPITRRFRVKSQIFIICLTNMCVCVRHNGMRWFWTEQADPVFERAENENCLECANMWKIR